MFLMFFYVEIVMARKQPTSNDRSKFILSWKDIRVLDISHDEIRCLFLIDLFSIAVYAPFAIL